MKRTIIVLIGIMLTTSMLTAQTHYSKQKLIEDIDSLYASVNETHVNMFANISKPEFEMELGKVKQQLADSMTKIDFYKILAPLIERLGDGHTSLLFPTEYIKDKTIKLFPFAVDVNYKDSTVNIVSNYSEQTNNIPVGAKILSINDRNIKEIVGLMFHYISGERTFFKAEELKFLFTPLLYALYKDSLFAIKYDYNNKIFSTIQPGISYAQRYKKNENISETSKNNYLLYIDNEQKTATIEFNSFVDLPRFQKFIDSSFVVIKQNKIDDLIIDIRKNGGGDSKLGDEFFQYISPVPYRQFGKTIVKNSRKRVEYYKLAYSSIITDSIGLQEFNDTTMIQLRTNENRFDGNLYLLISHMTFSSAANFSWAFKYFKMGTIIGEESGGLAVSFGDIISQRLPNTNIKYSVSHKKFYEYGATDYDKHGTLPDYYIPEKEALDFTIKLINKNKD